MKILDHYPLWPELSEDDAEVLAMGYQANAIAAQQVIQRQGDPVEQSGQPLFHGPAGAANHLRRQGHAGCVGLHQHGENPALLAGGGLAGQAFPPYGPGHFPVPVGCAGHLLLMGLGQMQAAQLLLHGQPGGGQERVVLSRG